MKLVKKLKCKVVSIDTSDYDKPKVTVEEEYEYVLVDSLFKRVIKNKNFIANFIVFIYLFIIIIFSNEKWTIVSCTFTTTIDLVIMVYMIIMEKRKYEY